ncbi:hypothetical protein CQ12_05500 [Bradyrhizobium jicamae]|uniref:Uncharacterized protein n=1 Tax=Bradyrhizobium jicamae TaxID=280332 RepID=A0A0R3LTL6_9BRAD|nr:hypothetical protein [Bradyrhizobium jicamae]KRR11282.1 hypothetical protein CQ12_05500 [Bradyrhizobium jicamae]
MALPDMSLMARLICSDVKMSAEARYLLAEMLVPGKPPIMGWKFQCKRTTGLDKARRRVKVEEAFRKYLAEGLKSREAAERAGSQYNIEGRQVGNIVKQNKKFNGRLARLSTIEMLQKIGGRVPGEQPSRGRKEGILRPRTSTVVRAPRRLETQRKRRGWKQS